MQPKFNYKIFSVSPCLPGLSLRALSLLALSFVEGVEGVEGRGELF